MSDVQLRPATGADLAKLISGPLPYRVRATAAERAGELLGVGGLAYLPTGAVAVFLLLAPGARRYRVALHKAALRTIEDAERLGIKRLVALAEPGIEPAVRWLERLGFREMTVDGEAVYVWQTRSP